MPRILLRAGKDPFAVSGPEETLARNVLGMNSGNALFSSAVHRILSRPGTEIVADGFGAQRDGFSDNDIARLDEEFDAFVLPMANAFRRGFTRNLDNLTRVIEGLSIPVVVVGVGAQLRLDDDGSSARPQGSEHILRFLRAVLERSASIGVRGEVTRNYLLHLGISDDQIDMTGCPSLSVSSGPAVVKKVAAIGPDSPISINLTAGVPELGGLLARHLARYRDMDFLPQENGTLGMLLWGEDDPEGRFDPRLPHHVDHPMYQQGRMRFFIDPTTWIDHLGTRDFVFGTRIHGNVAALMAGTPAVALPWDSRTSELCDFHSIPHRRATPELMATVDAAELYAEADFGPFNAARAGRRAEFVAFLGRNGLAAAEEFGEHAEAYDARLAEVPFAPPVTPLRADTDAGPAEIVRRLQWLRQGIRGDSLRTGLLPVAATTAALSVEALSKRVARLETARRTEADAASKLAAETTRKREAEVATLVTRVSTLERELKAERRKRAEVERRRPSARMRRLLRSPITTIRRRLAGRRPGASA